MLEAMSLLAMIELAPQDMARDLRGRIKIDALREEYRYLQVVLAELS
jgi:hypothetical protein